MKIYMRDSLKAGFDPELMFKVTRTGISNYKDFFGKDYPFSKYD